MYKKDCETAVVEGPSFFEKLGTYGNTIGKALFGLAVDKLKDAKGIFGKAAADISIKATFELYIDGGGDGTGACVLATVSKIEMGFLGLTIVFGRGIGGWCKHDYPSECSIESAPTSSPTPETSFLPLFDDVCNNKCDPSGTEIVF